MDRNRPYHFIAFAEGREERKGEGGGGEGEGEGGRGEGKEEEKWWVRGGRTGEEFDGGDGVG